MIENQTSNLLKAWPPGIFLYSTWNPSGGNTLGEFSAVADLLLGQKTVFIQADPQQRKKRHDVRAR